jgi:O-antigen/teichoic acid export membrane protein
MAGAGSSMTPRIEQGLSRRALARNSLLNLLGNGLPLVVGLIAIPIIVHGMGTDRFGLLNLAWSIIGYFSLFDLGLGRAMTQLVAEKIGGHALHEIPRLVWTGLAIMGALGCLGAVVAVAMAPWLSHGLLKIPEDLRDDAMWSFMALALAVPMVILAAGFVGVLTALQRFDLVNALRLPMGVTTFLVPLAVLPLSNSLLYVCIALVAVRAIFLVCYLVACLRAFPALRADIAIERKQIGRLLHFGGWMTVSNVISPLMVYLDRFVIGGTLSAAAVAYYATPYEMVIRLWVIPAAVVSTLFPAFATAKGANLARIPELFSTGTRIILFALAPLVLALVTFARDGLDLWLGGDFAWESTAVLQWLAVGVFVNSLGYAPFALVQGLGRPDLTAKLHALELPFYLLLLVWLLGAFGVQGAAMAWVARVTLDSTLLMVLSHRLVPALTGACRQCMPLVLLPLLLFLVGANLHGNALKIGFYGCALLAIVATAYLFSCSLAERQMLRARLDRFLKPSGAN